MKIVLINPPHTAIGSRIPDDHLPPLGLLSVGGPLIDDGHDVSLIDAEFGPMTIVDIIDRIMAKGPDLVLIGHSGSTSAHPTARAIAEAVKRSDPAIRIVYGGVFPTYHWREVLAETEAFDILVRGEGEETTRRLVDALAANRPLDAVAGIAYRDGYGEIRATRPAQAIADLDAYRIGWELIDHASYSYWVVSGRL